MGEEGRALGLMVLVGADLLIRIRVRVEGQTQERIFYGGYVNGQAGGPSS